MSDNIPLDIQVQIIKKLPLKSLLQFRSVSKTWKCLIDSPHFISGYSTQVQHLLEASYQKYVLYVDDDTFPQHKVSVPVPDSMVKFYKVCGCSHGLFWLLGHFEEISFGNNIMRRDQAVIWNPSIRKVVTVFVPRMESEIYECSVGFGVCRETMDSKIVKIKYIKNLPRDIESISCIPWQVEVFTLSTGAWRSSYSNLPRKTIQFKWFERVVEVDGFLYWLATDRVAAMNGEFRCCNLIVSFDLMTEEFREINLPDSLAYQDDSIKLLLHKIRGSFVIVLEGVGEYTPNQVFTVWMMEDGVPKSFTKLFTFNTSNAFLSGFRNSGEPIIAIEVGRTNDCHALLAVYDPYLKKIDNLGIDVIGPCDVFPYMETLLLLDHPDSVIYDEGKQHHISKWRAKKRRYY